MHFVFGKFPTKLKDFWKKTHLVDWQLLTFDQNKNDVGLMKNQMQILIEFQINNMDINQENVVWIMAVLKYWCV